MSMAVVLVSGREPLPVGGWVDADAAAKGAPHGLDGAEAATGGNGVDRQVGGLELAPGALHAGGLDVSSRCHAGLGAKGAREVALAHAGAGGERGHRQVSAGVLG